MERSEDEWRNLLGEEAYRVLRKKGTEPPFTGEYIYHKEKGYYSCRACGAVLFSSEAKYDSGSGWPSFFDAVRLDAIRTQSDYSHGMLRTEITCAQCGSHLGHVFEDGPQPTGLRYCVNSICLTFHKKP